MTNEERKLIREKKLADKKQAKENKLIEKQELKAWEKLVFLAISKNAWVQ